MLLAVVIPAKDEQHRLGLVLRQVRSLPVDLIVPVINGCRDASWPLVLQVNDPRLYPLRFAEPLGLDVPRAAGAFAALAQGAKGVLFVDGDWALDLTPYLRELIRSLKEFDVALVAGPPDSALASLTAVFNQRLGRPDLGAATPSYGPMAVSGRFLAEVPLADLAVPPVALVKAVQAGLAVGVVGEVPARLLVGAPRPATHRPRLLATVEGDYLEAGCVLAGRPRSRAAAGTVHLGFHGDRRLDLYLSPDFPRPTLAAEEVLLG